MSSRKPAMASKRAHTSKKITQKAQRAAQAVVRSSIARRAPTADSTKSPPEREHDADQEAHLVDSPALVLQDGSKQTMTDDDSKQAMTDADPNSKRDHSSTMAGVGIYQAKLMEMAQAEVEFAFEFAQRLARIRSPIEFLAVIPELMTRRIGMFRKYSKEMTELTIKR
jgi:hypothetical protein